MSSLITGVDHGADYRLLIRGLAAPVRLALAYAPARVKVVWLGLLALDARLAGVVGHAREPLLAQIRLAWWRDRLTEPQTLHPRGEPLLRVLEGWQGHHAGLAALVDGWEEWLCCADDAGRPAALAGFAEGRARACVALANVLGVGHDRQQDVARMGRNWGAGDLAGHQAIPPWVGAMDWHSARLAPCLRPLVVLHGLARRTVMGRPDTGLTAFATSVRLGLWG